MTELRTFAGRQITDVCCKYIVCLLLEQIRAMALRDGIIVCVLRFLFFLDLTDNFLTINERFKSDRKSTRLNSSHT